MADLRADTGWAEAVAGCAYVLHVASPTPKTVGEPAAVELIRPVVLVVHFHLLAGLLPVLSPPSNLRLVGLVFGL